MRIQFESTLDDLVDLHERAAARSRVARSWLWQGAAWSALLSGLIYAIPIFVIVYAIGSFPLALILAAIVALASAPLSLLFYRERIRQRYYTYFREQFGNRESFPFEAELSEAGIWTRQMGVQNIFDWANLEEMKITEDAVEFYFFGGSAVAVRMRAFASTDEQQHFIDEARQHIMASRTSSNWLRGN